MEELILAVIMEHAGTTVQLPELAKSIATRLKENGFIQFSGVLGFEATRPDPA